MPDANAGPTRSVSPWWLLLLLIPGGLFLGRWIASLPLPEPRAAERSAARAMPAALEPGEGRAPAQSPAAATFRQPPPTEESASFRWWGIGEAIAESKRTGKPVMFDFNAEWCPPCQRMKREVFENSTLARSIAASVIPVSVTDRTREDGANAVEIEELQRRFQIEAFPTLVVLSATTGRFEQQRGFGGSEYTQAWIERSAAAVR